MKSRFANLGVFISLALIIIPSLSWAAGFTDGLVVYLPFDEGTGKTAEDASGNKNHGTLEGPLKWENGKFGKALRFKTGDGTWVKVESNKQMNVNEFTFMAWVNIEDWVGGTRQIVGKSVHGGCAGRVQYGLFSEAGSMKLRLAGEDGQVDINAKPPATKEWVHIACSNDGKEGKIFYDGEEVAKGNPQGKLKVNDDPWAIGQDCERLNYIPTGLIDEVRLWNRALSEKEIGDYMKMGATDVFNTTAVTPGTKLPLTWSKVKTDY